MQYKIVDSKKQEILTFKAEVDRFMYIVVTEAKNENYVYLKNRLDKVRKDRMYTYLNFKDNKEPDEAFTVLELNVIREAKKIMEDELHRLNVEEGILLYLVRIEDED